MVLWSFVSLGQFWLTGRSSFLATRYVARPAPAQRVALVAHRRPEQGVFSDSCKAVSSQMSSCTYRTSTRSLNVSGTGHVPRSTLTGGNTVPIRLTWFWVSNYMAEIVGAFIATGLLRLRGVNGKAGWRYLFLIEGGLTLAIGIASFFMMPPSPTQTKAWFRPKGWFSERYVRTFCQS